MNRVAFLSLGVLLLTGGCYRTTIRSGHPTQAQAAQGYEERMHSAIVGDVVVIDPPYPLQYACPTQGRWATIETKISARDWFIGLLGGGVYQAQSVTVHCTKENSPPPPPAPTPPPPEAPPVSL
ncbi:hypothetical protein LZC95_03710 [Pendulispora brunnea]|uniref:Lipoprotein n=1 Tax=Pendulispora brunnea TaxID=2905690 RepID=A0ABZ2KBA4_9BACT